VPRFSMAIGAGRRQAGYERSRCGAAYWEGSLFLLVAAATLLEIVKYSGVPGSCHSGRQTLKLFNKYKCSVRALTLVSGPPSASPAPPHAEPDPPTTIRSFNF
jgi:hypothetical protein